MRFRLVGREKFVLACWNALEERLIDGVEVRLGDLIRDTCYRGFGRGTNTEQDV